MRVLLILGALGLLALAVWLHDAPREAAAHPEAPEVPEVPRGGSADSTGEPVPPSVTSSSITDRAQSASAPPSLSPHGWLIRGEVVDLAGHPVPGVQVAVPTATAWTDEQGRFSLRASQRGIRVELVTERLAVVAHAPGADGGRQRFVVAEAMDVAGRVLDDEARPLPGARVEARLDERALGAVPAAPDWVLPTWAATSEDGGAFEMERLPRGVAGWLRATLPGHGPAEEELPDTGRGDLLLRLPVAEAHGVAGRVVTALGRPAAGARISLGGERVQADADGVFRVALPADTAGAELVASHAEHGFARLTGDELLAGDDFVITLRFPEGRLAGRLLDEDGRPLEGWRVSVLRAGAGGSFHDSLRGDLRPHEACRTAEDGSFVLRGEFEGQELWLKAWGKGERTTATLGPLQRGNEAITWRVARATYREPASVLVVTPDERPVAGASLTVRPLLPVGSSNFEGHASQVCISDSAGGFHLTRAPRGALRLEITKAGFEDRVVEVLEHDLLPARIELARLCEVAVHAAASELSLAFLDGSGRRLPIRTAFSASSGDTLAALDGDRGSRFLVGESAQTLVVYEQGVELYRRSVRLDADRANRIEP